jgi:hypothetical protein
MGVSSAALRALFYNQKCARRCPKQLGVSVLSFLSLFWRFEDDWKIITAENAPRIVKQIRENMKVRESM